MALFKAVPLRERFWKHVAKEDGCWKWLGSKDKDGYGYTTTDSPRKKTIKAHRASWTLFRGPIPIGLCVLHKCDSPSCVNPDHLFLGTQADNVRDAVAKGRWTQTRRGENCAASKLNSMAVRDIRLRYRLKNVTLKTLGAEYGVAETTIWRAIRGECWGHVKQ